MKKLLPAVLFMVLGQTWTLSAAILTYRFTISTSALNAQADNLDFQLVPGDLNSSEVTLQISSFVINGGSYSPAAIVLTGDATGSLPNSLALDNLTGYNDAYQPITLGSSLSFLATVSGPGVNTPTSPGTSFGFSIYDSTSTNPLLTTSGDGTISGLVFNDLGGVAPFTNPATAGGASVASVTSVPEPSTIGTVLIGAGLAFVAGRRRLSLRS